MTIYICARGTTATTVTGTTRCSSTSPRPPRDERPLGCGRHRCRRRAHPSAEWTAAQLERTGLEDPMDVVRRAVPVPCPPSPGAIRGATPCDGTRWLGFQILEERHAGEMLVHRPQPARLSVVRTSSVRRKGFEHSPITFAWHPMWATRWGPGIALLDTLRIRIIPGQKVQEGFEHSPFASTQTRRSEYCLLTVTTDDNAACHQFVTAHPSKLDIRDSEG